MKEHIHVRFTSLTVDRLIPNPKSNVTRHAFTDNTLLKDIEKGDTEIMGYDGDDYTISRLLNQLEFFTAPIKAEPARLALTVDVVRHETVYNDDKLWKSIEESISIKPSLFDFSVDLKLIIKNAYALWQKRKQPEEPMPPNISSHGHLIF